MESWLSDNRGCFLVLQVLEANVQKVNEKVKERLESVILKKRKTIEQTKGGQLLLEKAFDGKEMRIELDRFPL